MPKNNIYEFLFLICKFHVLQIFNREITISKYNITKTIKNDILRTLQNMIYFKNLKEFDDYCKELYNYKIPELKKYFDDNWKNIYNKWNINLSSSVHFYNNTTNNRLESLNAKIKTTVQKFSTLNNFVDRLFNLFRSQRIERKSKIISECLKLNSSNTENNTEQIICNYLVPFAYEKIKNQILSLKNKINNLETYDTTIKHCTCYFFKSYDLPCCHIFVERLKMLLPIFDFSLCHNRWTRKHTNNFLESIEIPNVLNITHSKICTEEPKSNIKSFSQMMKYASVITNKLASTSSEYVGNFFDKSLKAINLLECIIRQHDVSKLDDIIKFSIYYYFSYYLVKKKYNSNSICINSQNSTDEISNNNNKYNYFINF